MHATTLTIVVILLVICIIQLGIQFWFERPFTTMRKARMVIYVVVVFTLVYRTVLYLKGDELITPDGLGIGSVAAIAMIALEYIRTREARGL